MPVEKKIEEPSYRILLSDRGIVEVTFIGRQTVTTVDASLRAISHFTAPMVEEGQPVNMLIDYGQIGKTTIEANQRALRGMRELTFHKMAGINAHPVIRLITNAIATASGDSRRAKHFKDRPEAEEWLLED